jgi:hypothetical protein
VTQDLIISNHIRITIPTIPTIAIKYGMTGLSTQMGIAIISDRVGTRKTIRAIILAIPILTLITIHTIGMELAIPLATISRKMGGPAANGKLFGNRRRGNL